VPSWSDNALTVAGPCSALRDFRDAVRASRPGPATGERAVLDFGRHLPMPPEVAAEVGDLTAGLLPGWYAWRIENWGTKLNAVGATVDGSAESGELRYRFRTAWTPPVEWLQFVAGAHPALAFELAYEEELGRFGGVMRFEAGRVVEDRCRAIYSPEAAARGPRFQVRSAIASR
jgi:hypothetical protein